MSGLKNFTIEQGADFEEILTYKIDSEPVNLGGYSARMQVRHTAKGTEVLVSLSSSPTDGQGVITLGGSIGVITISLTAAQTAAIVAGAHVYDLELVVSGKVRRLLEGAFNVTPEITR